jgi:hypothetical protein
LPPVKHACGFLVRNSGKPSRPKKEAHPTTEGL